MVVTLGWMLLAGLPLYTTSIQDTTRLPRPRQAASAAVPVAVWADRQEPYRRGERARIYLRTADPSHLSVFRVDTDGRIRVLFPREPWGDTYVRHRREVQVTGGNGAGSFEVDDYPGVGYLFAVASAAPFDFEDIARGDYWDFRLIEGGRIHGDPYVALTDLAARITRGDDYAYDIAPYYVDRRYDYPRFVCYECHAYARYDEWNPYAQACSRFRVVIRDDPRYYPYRSGRGRNIVMQRPAHPGPRYVFRDAEAGSEYVTRVPASAAGDRPRDQGSGRTREDIGGQGLVPAPKASSGQPERRMVPQIRPLPGRPLVGERRRRPEPPKASPKIREPQSTGEPELRRRKP